MRKERDWLRTWRGRGGTRTCGNVELAVVAIGSESEGFDFAAFLLSAAVAFFAVGFAIDYIVGRYGMGPYWNAFYATLGAYAGLCVRIWWLQPYAAYEPYLTTIAVAGGLLMMVVMASAFANR